MSNFGSDLRVQCWVTVNRGLVSMEGHRQNLAYLFLLSALRLGKFMADHRARAGSKPLAQSVGI